MSDARAWAAAELERQRELKRHKDSARFHEDKIEQLHASIWDAERSIARWTAEIAEHAVWADERRALIADMEEES